MFLDSVASTTEGGTFSRSPTFVGTIPFPHIYRFKNHGRTPALLISQWVGGRYERVRPSLDTATDSPQMGFVLGSDATSEPFETHIRVDGAEFDLAKKGDGFIFIYGSLTYMDIFRKLHETTFCYEWSFEKKQFVLSPRGTLNKHT